MRPPTSPLITLVAACVIAAGATNATVQDAPTSQERKAKDRKSRLADRLLRKAKTDAEEDLMEGIIRRMNEASRRLGVDFDAGEKTVSIQEEISTQLDEAIERAAKQRRPRRRSSPSANTDKRKMPTADSGKSSKQSSSSSDGAGADPAQAAGGEGQADGASPADSEFAELRRGWGHLPARDRDELIQGIEEQYLDRYRQWIEQYYRALQEFDE